MFVLKHHGGWSIFEAYNLPIQLRHWFVKRLIKEFEEQNKRMEEDARKSRSSRKQQQPLSFERLLFYLTIY